MAATAICEDARKLIVPGSRAYLNFHLERCQAAFAEPGKDPERSALPDAFVVLNMSTGAKSNAKSVDKTAGLEAFRVVAASEDVIGPRRCVGECEPGALKPH